MKTRIVITIAALLLYFLGMHTYQVAYSPITGAATAAQLDDTSTSYVEAKLIRDSNLESYAWLALVAILGATWIPLMFRRRPRIMGTPALAVILAMASLSSCTPVKTPDIVEIKSNETAWAIPMDGNSQEGQVKFNSVGFLNAHKVPTKRVWIDKVPRKTGRFYWDMKWIPATQVITVDRSLVTGQWTDGDPKNEADNNGIRVVTKDSVALRVGLTVTANIEEDDASTYLYYHGAKSLAQVMAQNIRSFAVAELTREYSQLSLSEAQIKGETIYGDLFLKARDAFKPKGVTIQYMGNAEGLTYDDPKVQAAINATYVSQQDSVTALKEQQARITRNATLVLDAKAEADAALKLMEAKEAASFKNELNIRTMGAQAGLSMAQRWNGQMPANVLPSNSPLLMQLGSK